MWGCVCARVCVCVCVSTKDLLNDTLQLDAPQFTDSLPTRHKVIIKCCLTGEMAEVLSWQWTSQSPHLRSPHLRTLGMLHETLQ